jgi:cell division protein FtsZ
MSIEIGPPLVDELKPRISVIGVGGAGGNAIANMIAAQVEGVDFIVANTDAQALNASPAERRIQLGPRITEGLGAGSRPEIGRAAAEETMQSVEQALETWCSSPPAWAAAPAPARRLSSPRRAREGHPDRRRRHQAVPLRRARAACARPRQGIEELQKHRRHADRHPQPEPVPVANPKTTFADAFKMADEVLHSGVRGITDLMVMPGLINLDFADVRSVMARWARR